jgi:hypothetical protein
MAVRCCMWYHRVVAAFCVMLLRVVPCVLQGTTRNNITQKAETTL